MAGKKDTPAEHAPDTTELPPHLARTQAEHATESDPKVVPLIPQGKGVDAPPGPPLAAADPVPRAVHQNERAPEGLKRFKLRCEDPPGPFRYILAHDEEEAVAHYLKSTGVQAVLDALPPGMRPSPRMTVRRTLPD